MSRINGKEVNLDLNNQNVNLAKEVVGLESDAQIVDLNGNDLNKQVAVEKFNDSVDQMTEKINKHEELLKRYHDELVSDMKELEICPIFDNLLVKPYESNPFQRIIRDEKTGLIIDTGGYTPEYKSKEDGEWHESEQYITVAIVIEAGPDCKYVRTGDVVFYLKSSAYPIPFYKQGFYKVNEHNISAVVNESLTKRFKNGNSKLG